MKSKEKHLEGKGEMDYDYLNDILFFKVENRQYDRSLEFENMVIDVDNEDFVVGLQIFDASKFLNVSKENLKVRNWKFEAKITPESIEIRLNCEINIRNMIRELSPIIIQQNTHELPRSSAIAITAL